MKTACEQEWRPVSPYSYYWKKKKNHIIGVVLNVVNDQCFIDYKWPKWRFQHTHYHTSLLAMLSLALSSSRILSSSSRKRFFCSSRELRSFSNWSSISCKSNRTPLLKMTTAYKRVKQFMLEIRQSHFSFWGYTSPKSEHSVISSTSCRGKKLIQDEVE